MWHRALVDIVSREKRSEMMAGIHSKDTKPEIYVRKLLHAKGYRFRLHKKDLPGKPDIVMPKYRLAIFVNGCFWHMHENCHIFKMPKSRVEFWEAKLSANRKRDELKTSELVAAGWRVLTIWECSLKGRGKLPSDLFEKLLLQKLECKSNHIMEIVGERLGGTRPEAKL